MLRGGKVETMIRMEGITRIFTTDEVETHALSGVHLEIARGEFVSIEGPSGEDGVSVKTEYRVWNPFRSKLAAGVLGGLDNIYIAPGKKVLYLGAASGTSVSHCSDIVGPDGVVYAVEFSPRSGRDLINMAKKRTNVIRACSSIYLAAFTDQHRYFFGHSYCGRCPPSHKIQNAPLDGRRDLCRRRAAGPGAHRLDQRGALPEEWWTCGDIDKS